MLSSYLKHLQKKMMIKKMNQAKYVFKMLPFTVLAELSVL